MKTMMLAGAAALAFAAVPAIAQNSQSAMTHGTMTADQMGMYEGWPQDRRADFDGWPENVRSYYWTLDADQQRGWWALTNDQRVRIHAMTPEQRTAAWTSINAQMSGTAIGARTSTAASTGAMASAGTMSGNIRWVSNEMVQNISADQAPAGDPPICTPNQQDNCINAWEAGKRGPNVTRPLDHWPGKPASEK